MPTDRSSSSKRPTTRRTRSASGKGPANEKLQSFDFEPASGRDDFGAGLADDAPSSRRSPPSEPAAPSDASSVRRRRTIASKPRFSAPPAPERTDSAPASDRSSGEPRSAPATADDRRGYNDEHRPERSLDSGDRGDSFNSDRDEGGGGRRSRRRRRGRGGDSQSNSGQRTIGSGRAPAAPQGRTSRERGSSGGGSSRGPSDRTSSSGGRYGRRSTAVLRTTSRAG